MKLFLYSLLFLMALKATAQQSKKYKIGDTAFCGIVFYVTDSGGIYQRGLVCSMQDVQTGIRWFNGSYQKTGSTANVLYDLTNTRRIIRIQGNGDYAATAAFGLNSSGDSSCISRSPWYLPSRTELQLLYTNLAKSKKVKFPKEGYWSSVESTQISGSKFRKAWIVDFFSGKAIESDKSNKYHVRAVQEFRNN